jgi:hypothetical protein
MSLPPHPAVIMQGVPWDPRNEGMVDYSTVFTSMCLETGKLGGAGAAECEVFRRKDTEANRIYLARHILDCSCGWKHEFIGGQ